MVKSARLATFNEYMIRKRERQTLAKTVFNKNKVDFTKQYMFFGEDCNTQRYDVFRYPEYDKLNQTMLGYFWRPEEDSLQKDRA